MNFTRATPDAFIALAQGHSRRRVIVAPAPGAQFLARVASIGSVTSSAWTVAIVVTAR